VSFWDHIKPTVKPPTATAVDASPDQKILTLTWDDGKVTRVAVRTLRQLCPCAECVDEWTRKRTFDPESVSPEMKVLEMRPVGNYAISFTFGDAHTTGIFNWTFLRETSEKHPA
jgi:DUF971 family protein